jgi:dinuclear metal center YbgI/SA1388 family protein
LEQLFPTLLAESWGNTGLLIGDRRQTVEALMTCLTVTPTTIDEAIERGVGLIVAHHPLPFRPVAQITTDTTVGRMLLRLIQSGIAVYSPHTRFDSAAFGINEFIVQRLGLTESVPLVELARDLEQAQGSGRLACLAEPLTWDAFVDSVKDKFGMAEVRGVACGRPQVSLVAVACGSGGSLLEAAIDQGCDAFVTGEINFHACLECESRGVGLVLLGHYRSERLGVEQLADRLQNEFSDLEVWASGRESDPICSF